MVIMGPMLMLEWVLVLLLAAVVLTNLAERLAVPHPSMLAVAGTGLAFLPFAPQIRIEPDLALALFVAPALLDAAFDTSPRGLRGPLRRVRSSRSKKCPGSVSYGQEPVSPLHLGWNRFGEDCASRATWTAGTSLSNCAMPREAPNSFRTLLPILSA
jgi:hypothetical protein